MSQERNVSPLPIGRYWLNVTGQSLIDEFNEWTSEMGGAVKVETTEETPGSLFVIFRTVRATAFFPAGKFGFPDKAPSSVKSRDDVEQSPDVEEPDLGTALQFAKTAGKVAAALFVAKLVVDLVKK